MSEQPTSPAIPDLEGVPVDDEAEPKDAVAKNPRPGDLEDEK